MKNTAITIILVILVVLLVNIGLYGAVAFINWEWNPKLWDGPTRFILVVVSLSLSIMTGMAAVSYRELKIHED